MRVLLRIESEGMNEDRNFRVGFSSVLFNSGVYEYLPKHVKLRLGGCLVLSVKDFVRLSISSKQGGTRDAEQQRRCKA